MFEKEAKEYTKENLCKKCHKHCKEGICTCTECKKKTYKDGAEFWYNKANEWNTETPSSSVGNKDLLLRVAKDDFDVGYYHFENKRFYTNDGREVTPLAWKEIRYPQESEK